MPGLPGESTDDKHQNEIDLISYTQTAGGKGCFSAVAVKSLDRASPGLAVLAVARQVVSPVTVTLVKAAETPLEVFVAVLEKVSIGTVELVEVDGDPLPVERVTLLPRRATLTYRQQNIDGSLGEPTTTFVTCK
ncbi:MAG TPA: type VI secretion system tube protein Hcp [Methylomirabilota bacterium]